MIMKKFNFIMLLLTLYYLPGLAQIDDKKQESHLLIALDRRAPNVSFNWEESEVHRCFLNLLQSKGIIPTTMSGYVYGIPERAKTPETFALQIVSQCAYDENFTPVLRKLYNNLRDREIYYSITSFAKPYVLMAAQKAKLTNRTYLAVITDMKYNGNDDYYGEIKFAKLNFSQEGNAMFKRDIKNVQTNYFCEFIGEVSISGGWISLYEYIPLQAYFSMESVLSFPKEVKAVREKDGYRCEITPESIGNTNYIVHKIKMVLRQDTTVIAEKYFKSRNFSNKTFSFSVPNEYKGVELSISISAWVKLNDGVYGNTILHPMGSNLQGAKGLNRTIAVETEEDALILGTFTLTNALFEMAFWTNDQQTAAVAWGWVFIISGIVIIVISVVLSIRYNLINKPRNSDIKI